MWYQSESKPATPALSEFAVPTSQWVLSTATAKTTATVVGRPSITALGSSAVRAVNPHIVAISGDVKNSTFSEIFQKAYPSHFYQGYIAEQNLVSVAVGLAARGKVPFADTFACFLSRAFDNLRMAAISLGWLLDETTMPLMT